MDKTALYPLPQPMHLNYLSLITVTGKDSASFLQGQLTCDITSISVASSSLAAFCNPKGRVISILLIIRTDTHFFLILPSSLQSLVISKLQRYILRAEVVVAAGDKDWQIIGSYTAPTKAADSYFCKLPGNIERYLMVSSAAAHDSAGSDSSLWQYEDIITGLPWFTDAETELYTPQMLGIDKLGGVSFTKGCYTGQEIIARTHYLGQVKRHLVRGTSKIPCKLPTSSHPVLLQATGQPVGFLLNWTVHQNQLHFLLVLQDQESDITALQLMLADEQTPFLISAIP